MAGVTAVIRVRALQPARRRAGLAFSPQPIDIGFDEIARAQFEQLLGDPVLVVSVVNSDVEDADAHQLMLTGMSSDDVLGVLDGLGLAFADEIVGDPIIPLEHNTGSPASADLDPAAGAADGGETTPAAPATKTSAKPADVIPASKAPASKPSGRKPKS